MRGAPYSISIKKLFEPEEKKEAFELVLKLLKLL